jgi:Rad3-related DNA helicase
VGAVLLLDERFLMNQYKSLFPREWENAEVVRISDVADKLSAFWEEHP